MQSQALKNLFKTVCTAAVLSITFVSNAFANGVLQPEIRVENEK